jgi:hypothetical protein
MLSSEFHNAECRYVNIIVLSVKNSNGVLLSVVLLSLAMLSAIMLCVILLNVVAPKRKLALIFFH